MKPLLFSFIPSLICGLLTADSLEAAQSPILVHAGGGAYTDSVTGETWQADTGSNGGQTEFSGTQVQGTSLSGLYQGRHFNPSGDLIYNFAVENGAYVVALRFAENFYTAPNSRVFNVWINGAEVRSDLDILQAVGGSNTAFDLQFPVSVTNGQVTIDLQRVVGNPSINALEILPVGGSGSTVNVYPGENIQQVVQQSPPGTTFHLAAGTYVRQRIAPKSGDGFVGDNGTIFVGSEHLTGPFVQKNGLYYATGQYQQGITNGSCDAQHPACIYPEDLFLNGTPLLRVTEVSQVAPGKWFFDYANHQIVFADNPNGNTLDTSITQSAFTGSAAYVTVKNITIQMYANPAQFGAIGDQEPGPGWNIQSVEVTRNHGLGIRTNSGAVVEGSYVHFNGSVGIGGSNADSILIENNEISSNNYAGYLHPWECGGAKFSGMNRLTVDGNRVHDNQGPGLWTDTDNFNTVYSNNTIWNNQDNGIQHERSFSAKIFNNTSYNNGSGQFVWLWGSQILIQNSQDVSVYNNTVSVASTYGNGIGLISQNRGYGRFGTYLLTHNTVTNNSVTYQQTSLWPASGVVADYNEAIAYGAGNNTFDYNHYHLQNPSDIYSWSYWGNQSWAGFHSYGQDVHGTADSNIVVR